MAFTLPNGSSFSFAATYSDSVTVTGISNASPAVVTATAHGFATGDVIQLTSGWVKLTGRAFKIGVVTADTFTLVGIDTTSTINYPTGSGAGSAISVETWVDIPQITEIASSGGEQAFYTFGFIQESEDRQIPTTKSPSVLTLTIADDPDQPFVAIVEAADESREITTQRLNLVNGDSILYTSYASITMTPSLTRSQLMTRTLTLSQSGRINRYSA